MQNFIDRYFLLFWSVFLIFIFICTTSFAQDMPLPEAKPEAVGLSSDRLNKIDTIFEAGISENKLPGAVIAIARRGKLVYYKAFGMQNTEKNIPMSRDSIFRIYSMTKPIVSVAVMKLHEEGKIYLSEPVGKYIPGLMYMKIAKENNIIDTNSKTTEIIAAKNKIKIHDLLRHT